jgi:DNA-directed RNA polymerase sigma subunit (sigma70/sigma32)
MQKKPTTPQAAPTRSSKAQVETSVTSDTTHAEVAQALAKGKANLSTIEEKALRMRHGVGAPRTLVLERVGQDHPDAREKLLGIELELLRQWKQRQTTTQRPEPRSVATPGPVASALVSNPKRDRIVAALKKKK